MQHTMKNTAIPVVMIAIGLEKSIISGTILDWGVPGVLKAREDSFKNIVQYPQLHQIDLVQ
jgi:hypothetical protein